MDSRLRGNDGLGTAPSFGIAAYSLDDVGLMLKAGFRCYTWQRPGGDSSTRKACQGGHDEIRRYRGGRRFFGLRPGDPAVGRPEQVGAAAGGGAGLPRPRGASSGIAGRVEHRGVGSRLALQLVLLRPACAGTRGTDADTEGQGYRRLQRHQRPVVHPRPSR